MELNEIIEAIKKWDSTRSNIAAMQLLFNEGNSFTFNYPSPRVDAETFLHTYLGVVTNSKGKTILKLFIIESDRDTEKQHNTPEGLLPHITVTDINVTPPINNVPEDEALKRIEKWKTSKDAWIAHQVQTEQIIPQIYTIPTRYLTTNPEYHAFFALNKRQEEAISTDISNYKGDMIVWDTKSEAVTYPREVETEVGPNAYFNTVRLCPPFGTKDKENFFLLKLSESI